LATRRCKSSFFSPASSAAASRGAPMPRRSAGARPHWGALVLTALPALGRILIARKIPFTTDSTASQRGGGIAACAPPPVSLTPQRSEGPPQRYAKGAADRRGTPAPFLPPLPYRCA